MKRLKELFSDDSAQGMLEYVLMLAVVIAIGMLFKDKIKGAIDGLTTKTAGDINGFSGQ